MAKIQNIGVARLFSTGRYEHTKISVNVEPGEKPGTMLREIQSLIEDLNPNSPVDDYQLQQAREALEKPEDTDGFPYVWTHEKAQEVIAKADAWQAKRDAAYARLDELGATPTVEESDKTPID